MNAKRTTDRKCGPGQIPQGFLFHVIVAAAIVLAGVPAGALGSPVTVWLTTADGRGADAEVSENSGSSGATSGGSGNGASMNARFNNNDRNEHILLRFDLAEAGISGPGIISAASLHLTPFRNDTNNHSWQLYGLPATAAGQDWDEDTIEFATAPGLIFDGNSTTHGVDTGVWTALTTGSFPNMTGGSEITLTSHPNVAAFLNGFLDGGGDPASFLIRRTSTADRQSRFATKEATALEGGTPTGNAGDFAPQLSFTFQTFDQPLLGGRGLAILNDGPVTFTEDATIDGDVTVGVGAVEYLVVGGGGAGGSASSSNNGYGGGGAGGFLEGLLSLGDTSYEVTVGAGGKSSKDSGVSRGYAYDGEDSSIGNDVVALGGGAGHAQHTPVGNGGSGGGTVGGNDPGSGEAGPPRQGHDGGVGVNVGFRERTGGGGGGAGEDGHNASSGTSAGSGGRGLPSDITGVERWYAGGGGGGRHSDHSSGSGGSGGDGGGGAGGRGSNSATDGAANTGGGGGGGATRDSSNLGHGGRGGSGVVYIRYAGEVNGATGGIKSTIAGVYTLHAFTDTGTDTFDLNGLDLAGQYATLAGSLSGNGGLTKTGLGTLELTGTNTYTGPTTVAEGTLLVNGDQSGATGAVTVGHGATLGGEGIIGGATTVLEGGILSPGNSMGTLTFLDTLTLNGGAVWDWHFGADTYDQVIGPELILPDEGQVTLNIYGDWSHLTPGATFTLFDGDVTGFDTERFLIADHTDHFGQSWTGIGEGYGWVLSEGSLLLTAVPEPASWLLLLSALACGLLVRRR